MLLLSLILAISSQKSSKDSGEIPSVIPISVPIEQMTKTGKYGTSKKACPSDKVATEPCGTRAWFNPVSHGSNPPTFSYTFKGEKYQVYGKMDSDHGKFRLFLDDEVVGDFNQYTSGADVEYALHYTSDILPYGWHTIKVTPLGDDIEIYKFTYWPSVHAKRLNSTEIGQAWKIESDGIGGLREWANENYKTGVKKIKTFKFSKFWLYGSTYINHGKMFLAINGDEHYVDQNTTKRIDGVLVYESEILPLNDYTLTMSQYIEDCLINCLYYIDEPQPTPEPISVSVDMMTKTGKYGTVTNKACPNDKVATEPCGKTVWFNPSSQGSNPPTFSYTFKGEKYQVFGKLDKDHGKFRLFLDDEVVGDFDQYTSGPDQLYYLHYTSDIIPYGWHTIKVTPLGDDIEIYKFTYWPSVRALRLNSTEFKPIWNKESDGIGGLREWAHENNHANEPKTRTIRFSKIWVYGSSAIAHGDMLFTLNGKRIPINQNTTSRIDNYLVYESDYLPLEDYTISFSQHVEDCVLHSIFYLPGPEPTPIPISVPYEQMNRTGNVRTSVTKSCPKDAVIATEPCGTSTWYNPANGEQKKNPPILSYTFKGVRFCIYGKYDDSHGTFKLYVDDKFVKDVNQKGSKDSYYQLQYTSDVLPYREHTIRIEPDKSEFEIAKFEYWPTLHAERVNSTEVKPIWNKEADGIGGIREWAHEGNHPGEKKTKTVLCSKFWVYGSTASHHGDMLVKIDDKEYYPNLNTSTRVDGVLVFESDYMPLENHTISISQHVEDCVLNCFYYDPKPSPEPEPEDYILNDDNCKLGVRCQKEVNNVKENIQVYVDVTKFKEFTQESDGGAIYIKNAALKVNKSDFTRCKSTNGGGGAIYCYNTFEITNTYLIENIRFRQCAAQYGGAVYLYSSSMKVDAQILNCEFRENQCNGPKGAADGKFGGSALYLSVYKGKVDLCNFIDNKGYGGIWKVINKFPETKSALRTLSFESVLISNCQFKTNKNDDCAVFYLGGLNGPQFEFFNCVFFGELSKNSYYIDGQNDESNKLVVRSCRFASDSNKAFNKNLVASIDMKSQVFQKNDAKMWKIIYTLVLPIVGVLAIIALAMAIIIPRKLDKKATIDTELPAEVEDSLL